VPQCPPMVTPVAITGAAKKYRVFLPIATPLDVFGVSIFDAFNWRLDKYLEALLIESSLVCMLVCKHIFSQRMWTDYGAMSSMSSCVSSNSHDVYITSIIVGNEELAFTWLLAEFLYVRPMRCVQNGIGQQFYIFCHISSRYFYFSPLTQLKFSHKIYV